LPSSIGNPQPGDLATIQVVEASKHGAGQFSCVDIIFTDDESLLPPLNEQTCFNSTDVRADHVNIVPEGPGQVEGFCENGVVPFPGEFADETEGNSASQSQNPTDSTAPPVPDSAGVAMKFDIVASWTGILFLGAAGLMLGL